MKSAAFIPSVRQRFIKSVWRGCKCCIKIRLACSGSAKLAQNDVCVYTKVGRLSCQLIHPVTFAYIVESLKKLGCSKVISTVNDNFWVIFPPPYPNAQCITLIIDPASNAYGSPFLICCCCWLVSFMSYVQK